MAWTEQIGPQSWRVRYPTGDGHTASISGFTTKQAADNYANDIESDQRRNTWLDPSRGKTTVASIVKLLSMMLTDAADERLIPDNPIRRRRRRGRRARRIEREKIWATPEEVLRIANQATLLDGEGAGLLIITAAWTGCRWGELTGLHRDNLDLDADTLTIDALIGALHESTQEAGLWPCWATTADRPTALALEKRVLTALHEQPLWNLRRR